MIKGIIIETTDITEDNRKALEDKGFKIGDSNKMYTAHWILPMVDNQYHDHQEVYFSKKELVKNINGIKKWLTEEEQ